VNFGGDKFFSSLQNYTNYFQDINRCPPQSGYAPKATLCGLLLREALMLSNSGGTDVEDVFNTLITESWDTFVGRFVWTTDHSQSWENLFVQFLSPPNDTEPVEQYGNFLPHVLGTERVISPALAKTHELIYPAPGWNERVFKREFGDAIEIVLVAIVLVMIVANICWCIFTIKFWNHTVIRAASPSFLILVLLGSIMLYLSVLSFLPNLINDTLCKLRAWLLGIGFVVVFGAFFAKSWRVYNLFSNTAFNGGNIPDREVWIIIGVLVGMETILLLGLTFGAEIVDEIILIDKHRQSMNHKNCIYNNEMAFFIILAIIYSIKAAFIIWGVVLSIQLRGVKYRVYNEASVMAFSM